MSACQVYCNVSSDVYTGTEAVRVLVSLLRLDSRELNQTTELPKLSRL